MVEYFWKNGRKEEKMNTNVSFMRKCKRVEFGMNLDLIHGNEGGINMWGGIIN